MTYRLLIADDENIERSAIKLMVNKNLYDFKVVGEAENGIEAIERARVLRPDIVLMDIKMPGIDGLAAIAEIRKFDENVRFVVLSAHNDFEYAQSAIKLGADDYLLKPARFHKLTETLNDIAHKLDMARVKAMQEKSLQNKIESLRPDLENRIIASVTSGINTSKTLRQYAQFLDIELQNSICMVIRFLKPLPANADRPAFLQTFKDKLLSVCPYFLADFAFEMLVVLIPVDVQWNAERVSQWSLELGSLMKGILKSIGAPYVNIGISDAAQGFDGLHNAYRQAARSEQRTLATQAKAAEPSEIYRKELKLCEKIALGDLDQSLLLFAELSDSYHLQSPENVPALKTRIRDLMIVIKRKLIHELNQSVSLSQMLEAQLSNLENICTRAEIFELMRAYITQCVALCESGGSGSSHILDSAVGYIAKNYTNSFSLEDVAFKLGVSAPYLSRLFKLRLGKNFIDYITELRIQYAKELLAKRNMSIKEITYTVGYNSQTYFCKVFKKVVGISASQYTILNASVM